MSDARRLKQLEDENRKLKRLVTELCLVNAVRNMRYDVYALSVIERRTA